MTPSGGLFQAEVDLYARVTAGDRIGTVRDLFGEVVYEVPASKDGVVICLRHVARCFGGDALAVISPDAGAPEYEQWGNHVGFGSK